MKELELNKIHNIDCLEFMKTLPDNSIDMTLTSPPYDNLRDYKGYTFNFESIAKELFRVIKDGGVVVWVVGDAVIDGSESGTSFKQALFFKECGFRLHDTMIWHKPNAMPQVDKSRFTQSFEYMFVFSKGKPLNANPIKIPTKNSGKFLTRGDGNEQNINKKGGNVVSNERIAFNVYSLNVGGTNNGHPAVFPEQLAKDNILSWSNENDIVFDPFMGSGTTGKVATMLKRNYIGCEISKEYCDIAEARIKSISNTLF